MEHDVIVIGGSYAGMAAALQLLRARRRVLILDAGRRRNHAASHAHGFLGQDGVPPADIWSHSRAQLLAYPTLTWVDARVSAAAGGKDAFTVTTMEDESFVGRRILFATGVADDLPAIPGLGERWGRSVFHCPYCHGYELDQGAIAVIATGPSSIHQAQLLPEWGAVTFFTNGAIALDDAARADLAARGVQIEEGAIARIEGVAEVVMQDGRRMAFAGAFTASRNRPASDVAAGLGCAIEETPFGLQVATDQGKETSVPGAYAAGDVARIPHSLSLAVADGAWAGANIHRSLVFPG